MSNRVQVVSPSGVVEFIDRPVVESLSAGVNWNKIPVQEQAQQPEVTHKLALVSWKKSKKIAAPVSRKAAPSEVGTVSGVISGENPKRKRKEPTYKQRGLQSRVKNLAGFAGWK